MTQEEMVQLAIDQGFSGTAVVETKNIPFDPSFRAFCEENICGMYDVNHSCPPHCGNPGAMKRKLKSYSHALVLQSMWEVADYSDQAAIKQAKAGHNAAALRLMKAFEGENMDCFLVGVSGCTICNPCALVKGQPCAFPKKQWSCMSAYCVFVRELADLCGLEYDCGDGLLAFFGMIVFRDQELGA